MSTFSIKDLEQLSGIKAHTIRIWEQRYELLAPSRTDTNIRYYDDHDLKLVLNVASLKNNGFKISRIARMSHDEIQQEVRLLSNTNFQFDEQIKALTIAMIDLDEERFEKIMSNSILKLGFEKTMVGIVYPFLTRIGVLWQTGAIKPAQEHFISNLIRQKLVVAIDNQFMQRDGQTKKYVLYLPEGELHELGLLFMDYIVRSRRNLSIYLGQSLPFADVVSVCDHHNPDYICTMITTNPGPTEVKNYIEKIASRFPNSQILISGFQVAGKSIEVPDNVKIIHKIDEMIQWVEHEPALYA